MSDEIKLCRDCSFFIHAGEQCGNSRMAPDYVFGRPAKTRDAQTERLNSSGCGPTAKNFAKIIQADYAEAMTTRDQRERFEGRADVFGVSACGRSDRAGS